MPTIKISPDQVRQLSGQFKQASQQSQELYTQLNNTVQGLQGEWEGMTQQRFFQDFEQWKTQMTQFVQMLDNISQQLDQIATRFETVDTGGG